MILPDLIVDDELRILELRPDARVNGIEQNRILEEHQLRFENLDLILPELFLGKLKDLLKLLVRPGDRLLQPMNLKIGLLRQNRALLDDGRVLEVEKHGADGYPGGCRDTLENDLFFFLWALCFHWSQPQWFTSFLTPKRSLQFIHYFSSNPRSKRSTNA